MTSFFFKKRLDKRKKLCYTYFLNKIKDLQGAMQAQFASQMGVYHEPFWGIRYRSGYSSDVPYSDPLAHIYRTRL